MKTKTRDSGPQRERKLSSLFHRVSPGKWLAMIFFARVVWSATGCSSGPADGSPGGQCADGCAQTCYDGSVCDEQSNTCSAPEPLPSGSSGGVGGDENCDFTSSPDCEENEEAFVCSQGYAELTGASCRSVGGDIFCCDVDPSLGDASSDASADASNDDAGDAATDDASDADSIDSDAGDE